MAAPSEAHSETRLETLRLKKVLQHELVDRVVVNAQHQASAHGMHFAEEGAFYGLGWGLEGRNWGGGDTFLVDNWGNGWEGRAGK